MFPNCHPCIKRESLNGLSHHPMEKKTYQKWNLKKKNKLQYQKGRMLIEIKGHVKPAKHQFKKNMEYDGMNEDEINPNGKHQ